ncbi:hypothetical protein Vadar_026540 [Vaccinium darrowii]|uniref:Uncharacterized protein n=1 Tax=Vaccinium darrowii TaxID=229202 RepID=A0ACB7YZH9_9ERIC|nr:hypothetical protein Vadar_026540 [Vaccinium darrowii]
MHGAAKTYYAHMSNSQHESFQSFYGLMGTNGDGRVSISEYSAFIREQGYDYVPSNLFGLLDKNNTGYLDYEECITFFYMVTCNRITITTMHTPTSWTTMISSTPNHGRIHGHEAGVGLSNSYHGWIFAGQQIRGFPIQRNNLGVASYAEALMGHKEEQKDKESFDATFKVLSTGDDWLLRSAVAKLHKMMVVETLVKGVQSRIGSIVEARSMGGRSILLTFIDSQTRDVCIFEKWWERWFNSITEESKEDGAKYQNRITSNISAIGVDDNHMENSMAKDDPKQDMVDDDPIEDSD